MFERRLTLSPLHESQGQGGTRPLALKSFAVSVRFCDVGKDASRQGESEVLGSESMNKKDLIQSYGMGALGVMISQGFLIVFVEYGRGEPFNYPLIWGLVITTMLISFARVGRMP